MYYYNMLTLLKLRSRQVPEFITLNLLLVCRHTYLTIYPLSLDSMSRGWTATFAVNPAKYTIAPQSDNFFKTAGGALVITGTGRWGALGPPETAQGLTSTSAADSCWVWIKDSSFSGSSVHGIGGGGALRHCQHG